MQGAKAGTKIPLCRQEAESWSKEPELGENPLCRRAGRVMVGNLNEVR
jgi:hypothetical protein